MESRKVGYKTMISLVIVIVLSLLRVTITFIYLKEDYHSDEIWSFGLSNSYYEPFIYQSADHTEITNMNSWFPSSVMRDYLTVDKEHRFCYDSVIFNQDHDYHPPLYYLILHTICSFFPGKISFWYAFSINIFAYIIASVFFYKLIYQITKSEITALYGYMFYAFSSGILNTFVFVRMYALLSMFAVLCMYYHARLYYTGKRKYILSVMIITLLGALTHHFYLPFAAGISLCFCIYYIIKKKYKTMFEYGLSILGTAVLSVIIYPATIDHLFSGRIDDPKYTLSWQIIMTLNCMLSELFGFCLPVILDFSLIAVMIVVFCSMLIISPLFFLFRKNEKFKRIISSMKNWTKKIPDRIKRMDLIVVSSFVSSLVVILLTAFTVSLMFMNVRTDRYIFIIYPCICVVFIYLIFIITKKLLHKSVIRYIIAVGFCLAFTVFSNLNTGCIYLFEKPDDAVSVKEITEDSNCVLFNEEHWFLTCFTYELTNSNYIFSTTGGNMKETIINLPDVPDKDKPLYFIVNAVLFKNEEQTDSYVLEGKMPRMGISSDKSNIMSKQEFETLVKGLYPKCEYVGHDVIFETEYCIYRVN